MIDLLTLKLAQQYTDKAIKDSGSIGGGDGGSYNFGDGLTIEGNTLSVETVDTVEEGNDLPVSSAAVSEALAPLVENIESLAERQTVVISKAEDVEEEIYYIEFL